MPQVTIYKLDHAGRQVIAYPGRVLERGPRTIVLRTEWDREPMDLGFVLLEPDDRWTEYFFADRWYNIFEIRASDGSLKGWYCNITRPAQIGPGEVKAEDLALDLWVAPGGDMQVLDEDEFAALSLSLTERETARNALAELQTRVTRRLFPFSEVGDG
jgi:hypothetical protein